MIKIVWVWGKGGFYSTYIKIRYSGVYNCVRVMMGGGREVRARQSPERNAWEPNHVVRKTGPRKDGEESKHSFALLSPFFFPLLNTVFAFFVNVFEISQACLFVCCCLTAKFIFN